ncbi:MAG: ATP-binding protein, partial [Nitrosospira sp.]
WGVAMLTDSARRDLLEILDDRYVQRSTIVTSQLKVDDWHASIGDPILADAILDRFVHNAHKLDLSGESIRKKKKVWLNPAIRSKKQPSRRYAPTVQFAVD